jgi:broad specificity phosphatase PhoE
MFLLAFLSSAHFPRSLAGVEILIVRHAEKPDDGIGLTPAGQERAAAYVGYFAHFTVDGAPLKIDHIFAAADSKNSIRPRLTVEPLANALQQKIDLRFTDKDPEAIASDLRAHDYGKHILICWRHGKIPGLLEALGANPSTFVPEGKWPENIYDRVIELRFDANGKVDTKSSKLVFEHLRPGDEK